jgi:hypothetical protein
LTQCHRQTHVAWATTRLHWTQRQWKAVLFADEFRFHVDFADRCVCVCRGQIEQFHPKNVIQRNHYGGSSVMISDKIVYQDKTGLVKVNATPNSQPYCEGIVVPKVIPFHNQGQVTIFHQYNARLHTAGQSKEVLRQSNIDVLKLPTRSPDLSPIEHV